MFRLVCCLLQERNIGKTINNGKIYLLDLEKVKAKSAYFKPERKICTMHQNSNL